MSKAKRECLCISYSSLSEAQIAWLNRYNLITEIGQKGLDAEYIEIQVNGMQAFPRFRMNSTTEYTYQKVLEMIGNADCVATITAMETDTCLLINDKGSPDRIIWTPAQYQGLNWRWLWRDTMDDYERMIQGLRQESKLDNFTYRMRRVDGSLAEYTADYQLIPNFLGVPARLAYNREWRLIEPARVRQ